MVAPRAGGAAHPPIGDYALLGDCRGAALVARPSLRLNKALTMRGITAAGVPHGLMVEGARGALVHADNHVCRVTLVDIHRTLLTRAYLEARDAPFQPEPMGPRSARGREKRNAVKKKTS